MKETDRPYIIAPSILAADWTRLGEEVRQVLESGADWIHFDVMDNHYTPNLAFTPQLCEALRRINIKSPIDVHLQANPIEDLVARFSDAGATYISFHPETTTDVNKQINYIHSKGLKAGLAFSPDMGLEILDKVHHTIDLIVIMSVSPGFGGQRFMPDALNKVTKVKGWIKKHHLDTRLAVDGGITLDNISEVAYSGADTFMIGTAIFKSPDYKETLALLRKALND